MIRNLYNLQNKYASGELKIVGVISTEKSVWYGKLEKLELNKT